MGAVWGAGRGALRGGQSRIAPCQRSFVVFLSLACLLCEALVAHSTFPISVVWAAFRNTFIPLSERMPHRDSRFSTNSLRDTTPRLGLRSGASPTLEDRFSFACVMLPPSQKVVE